MVGTITGQEGTSNAVERAVAAETQRNPELEPVQEKYTETGGNQNLLFVVSRDMQAVDDLHKAVRDTYGSNKSDSIIPVRDPEFLSHAIESRLDSVGGEIARLGILNYNDDPNDNSFATTIIPQLEGILKAAKDKVHNIYTATTGDIKTLALRTRSTDPTEGVRGMNVELTNQETNLKQQLKDFANMITHNYAEAKSFIRHMFRPNLKAATIEEFRNSIYQPSGPKMKEEGIEAFLPFVAKVIG
ncbi:MAG: hypothetical protein OXU45_05690 [Candidatus Melainabacteria bacterium]|nr:hypothetical protein [Candidatus Melainabacteria bacterium]